MVGPRRGPRGPGHALLGAAAGAQPLLSTAAAPSAVCNLLRGTFDASDSLCKRFRKVLSVSRCFPGAFVVTQPFAAQSRGRQVDVTNFGATISAVRVRDGDGWVDVVLGYESLAQSAGVGIQRWRTAWKSVRQRIQKFQGYSFDSSGMLSAIFLI